MSKIRWIGLFVLLAVPLGQAHAQGWRKDGNELAQMNNRLCGKVVDYTANHGTDNRIWSPQLFQRRDLYVYLPPGYQPCQRYPLMIWMHGFCQDEKAFLLHIAPVIDEAIKCGKLPPMIVAAPDGTFKGEPECSHHSTFFLNSELGGFADFVLYDVFDFVVSHYPIRPEREAHILAGCGMGGFAAFNYGIKHRDAFGVALGICAPLNLRWQDKRGNHMAHFDPRDWDWCQSIDDKRHIVCRLLDGGKRVGLRDWFGPMFGDGAGAIEAISAENPIEMVDRYQLQPGQLEMYVAYTSDDEYNVTAQVESFLYLARWRGLCVGIGYQEIGRNNIHTAVQLLPRALDWLTPRVAPFSPLMPGGCAGCGTIPCSSGACCQPKHRLIGAHLHQQGGDLSCHLPPMWLPDHVEDGSKK